MKIVSGKVGIPHVTSHEFRQIIEGTVGQGSCILKSGDNLEPELVSNNLIKIKSGMMAHHGNVSSVENYDEVELKNGTQGMKRIDLIVNRYTRNDETKIENNSWVCIMGTPDASNPVIPDYIVGNMQNGDLVDDCPYLEVHYDGINVTEVKKLLSVAKTASEIEAELAELNKKCSQAQNGIEHFQVASNGVTTKAITFNPAFDNIPVISTAFNTSQLGTDKMCITSITNKQVIFAVYTTTVAHSVEIHWRAEPQK